MLCHGHSAVLSFYLFICLFPWCKHAVTCQVHLFSSFTQREKKSGPRHISMKPQHSQPGAQMFFISFSIWFAFQGPSWCWFRCGMAAKGLWSVLGEHVWYSPSCSAPQSWQEFFGPLAKGVLQCRCWQAVPAGWLEDTVKTDPLNGLELQGSTYPFLYCYSRSMFLVASPIVVGWS